MKFKLPEKLRPYENRIVLSVVFLIVGVLLLTIGFWRTLLLAVLVGIGYLVGSYRDGTFANLLNRFYALIGRM